MPLPQDARRELCPASDAPGPPSVIESTLDDGVATVRLASPATANALTPAAFADLAAAVARWQHPDSGARALVLTGSGGVFSAGANLDVLGDADAAQLAWQIGEALHPLLPLLRGGRLPTLAAVNGVAVGGAVGLALWCDVVVAASSARFSLAFARLGLVPDTGLSWLLPRLVGEARARAWLLTGAEVPADAAAAAGMIHAAVPDPEFEATVRATAQRLARLPQSGFAATRRLLEAARTDALDSHIDLEAREQAELVTGAEFRAAMAAFAARRRGEPGK